MTKSSACEASWGLEGAPNNGILILKSWTVTFKKSFEVCEVDGGAETLTSRLDPFSVRFGSLTLARVDLTRCESISSFHV